MPIPTEQEGCAILKRVFEARGYKIQDNVQLDFEGVSLNVDGWDPELRVGFEYITKDAGDHEDLTPEEMAQLATWTAEGRLALFMIDHADVLGETELEFAGNRFLDDLAARQRGL